VTEPAEDPIAALAAQLEELRGQLARYTGETGHLRARLEERSGQDAMIRLEIKQLGGKLDEAIAKRQVTDPPAPFWRGLDREAHAARLAELRDFVEHFLRAEYPEYLAKLPPCWPSHRAALWELADVMTEWVRVYGDPGNRDLQAALWFHERWLPGVMARLEKAIRCDASGCRLAQPSPYQRSPPRCS
jgi:hypothetical protein